MVENGEKEWDDLLIFGRYEYAGGASPWLGIRKADEAVYGLDLERENALFLLNSSIEQFIRTFKLLDEYLGEGKRLPADVEAAVRDIDREAYPVSDWRLLIDYLNE